MQADIKICVLDINDLNNTEQLNKTLDQLDNNTIILFNKSDTLSSTSSSSSSLSLGPFERFKHKLHVSCLTSHGVPQFMAKLEQIVADLYAILSLFDFICFLILL